MTDRQTELLPCPFCNERLKSDINNNWVPSIPILVHPDTNIRICPLEDYCERDNEENRRAWNTRATPNYVKPLVEALQGAELISRDSSDFPDAMRLATINRNIKLALSKLPEDLR